MAKNNVEEALREAEVISEILAEENVECIVIGGIALAFHRYIRFTQDVDLAVDTDLNKLRNLAKKLSSLGYQVVLREPDLDDPLGGLIDITGDFGIVQIVNFGERFPIAVRDALSGESIRTDPSSKLRIVPIPQLVALKLYAGGWSSFADIVEMLRRNPEADLKEIGNTCRRYRIRGWDRVLDELGVKEA